MALDLKDIEKIITEVIGQIDQKTTAENAEENGE